MVYILVTSNMEMKGYNYVMITLLSNCILTHGIAPDDVLLGKIIYLIKIAEVI